MGKWAGLVTAAVLAVAAQAQDAPGAGVAVAASPVSQASENYQVRQERWSEADEKEFGQFIVELGESGCNTVNKCLHDPRNPFRGTDPASVWFRADCADLPYVLRFYFAWKRGLPFSYISDILPRGYSRDWRYSAAGNSVTGRTFPVGANGYSTMITLMGAISSATYRLHPELETPEQQDFYSPAIKPKAIRPGTTIYDPNGHVAIVWKVERNGRIHYFDAHPDYSITRGFYDARFVRSFPGMGSGFKNWRPQTLVGAKRAADGTLRGGHVELTANKAIADFGVDQFYGNGTPRPADDAWNTASFTLNGEIVGYYDYVRGQLAGGTLLFDPIREVGDMVTSNCDDLQYRVAAVDLAIAAGLHRQNEPERLPANIYGTDGDWETYSSPSRDARLKTAFKELYDSARRFQWMASKRDPKLAYKGKAIATDMLAAYDAHAAQCKITYTRSNGSKISFSYEEARRRLFALSFDPYQCPERRWGATKPDELSTCPDGALKTAWYLAEQNLRNQLDRTYEARMDFTLAELKTPGPGKGVPAAPETDIRTWLVREAQKEGAAAPPAKETAKDKPWWPWQ